MKVMDTCVHDVYVFCRRIVNCLLRSDNARERIQASCDIASRHVVGSCVKL